MWKAVRIRYLDWIHKGDKILGGVAGNRAYETAVLWNSPGHRAYDLVQMDQQITNPIYHSDSIQYWVLRKGPQENEWGAVSP